MISYVIWIISFSKWIKEAFLRKDGQHLRRAVVDSPNTDKSPYQF